MPDVDCPHDGDTTRRFGGSIVCDDCSTVVGNWRTEPTSVTATELPDGTLHVDSGGAW